MSGYIDSTDLTEKQKEAISFLLKEFKQAATLETISDKRDNRISEVAKQFGLSQGELVQHMNAATEKFIDMSPDDKKAAYDAIDASYPSH